MKIMILYRIPKNQIENIKTKTIYKLKVLHSETEKEIELSRFICNIIPYWSNYFLPICEVKMATVRDIYRQTTDDFLSYKKTNHVLLRYNVKQGNKYQDLSVFFSKLLSLSKKGICDLIYTYQNMLDILYLLNKYGIIFVGLNNENILINEDRNCLLTRMTNGFLFREIEIGVEEEKQHLSILSILSIKYESDNAIYYPIDYYFIRYMEENDIYAPSFHTIEMVWDEWSNIVTRSQIKQFFTEDIMMRYKRQYWERFAVFINKKKEDIYANVYDSSYYILSKENLLQWNIYGLNIVYLHLLQKNEHLVIFEKIGFVDLFMSYYSQNMNILYSLKEIECIFCDIVEKYTETEWLDIFALF
jgi:hypothetical protein